MKKQIKDYSIHFLKEIIPVIAGILIALFIDNWNTDRKDKNYINQVLLTINSELKDSKEDIKTIIPQHESLIDSLGLYSNNKNISIMDVVNKSNGINIPQIKTNAWKSVSSSKIDLIDYDKITLLSNIEDEKATLNKKSDFLMSFLYSNIHAVDKNSKLTLELILKDILQTEKTMQKRIEQFESK
ncbi:MULTISPECIES: hypothetical protein [Sphingobacterium]|uniref:Uncharacterized protein n=1 Tax=Sphingobacterium cellulitidis TaxID=1768011 RepID=A0A8H9FYX3_9SPHI|nr:MULTISPECIES: hypothetical protein [Sphingobacterium]MBA8987624.1 hypothetical protein [Sphingobacterium soli]WFB64297.1 hypothetical protein PZ892_03615 [Sphingobacterium sp. WM]GGE21798.1 hypothetical protein GCM10011516_19290 [Sphingobacterium soli]